MPLQFNKNALSDARACLDRIMPILTPAQINAAQKAALAWRPRTH